MDKTSQKVTKDPKRIEAVRKGRENPMNELKESILNDVKKILAVQAMKIPAQSTLPPPPANSTINTSTTPATSATNTATSDTYIYGVGILAVLAIGVCIFFAYNTSQATNKKQVNKKQDQSPKRRHIL